jgi:hypothetical protein
MVSQHWSRLVCWLGLWFLLEPWGPGLGFFFNKEEDLLALSLINIFKVKLVGFGSGLNFLFLTNGFGPGSKNLTNGLMCQCASYNVSHGFQMHTKMKDRGKAENFSL